MTLLTRREFLKVALLFVASLFFQTLLRKWRLDHGYTLDSGLYLDGGAQLYFLPFVANE